MVKFELGRFMEVKAAAATEAAEVGGTGTLIGGALTKGLDVICGRWWYWLDFPDEDVEMATAGVIAFGS